MRFILLDAITQLEVGYSITAQKRLRPDEDYLKDHFPKFPVMPGVLMLEAMFQTCAWLIHKTNDFAEPIVLLQEARSVKYSNFLAPNQVLVVTAEIVKREESITKLKVHGTVEGAVAVSGRLALEQFRMSDRYPNHSTFDPYARQKLKSQFAKLWQPQACAVTVS